jgi:thiamine-monophosphate kinase
VPSEFELIRRFFARPARAALLGVGDDAALLQTASGMELAVSTDLLVEGRHFRPQADARKLGHKALAVNLSDMAAMGATPRWTTLALALPAADEAWLAAFADGFYALAARFGVDLVGGDTTRGPLSIGVTILGEVPAGRALKRSGAAPGDDVWVSGELGGAALGLAHPEIAAAAKRLDEPEPRVRLGERLRGVASSAIDVSDGFAQDLGHILEASGVGAVVEMDLLPCAPEVKKIKEKKAHHHRLILSGGDDYEIVFTAKKKSREVIAALARELGLALARVGTIEKGNPILTVIDRNRKPVRVERGFDHFAA